ncbi:hypothetical protein COLSTE_01175 [Collinsella stercoris DSM 13279]|uniref:Uncharacterized protein n=1 Tax=Collinsella stercoris DSM 13279 TaxID=445975 RepID=B6GAS5_9ACTN|nr:hypothetical protein COLSTE_01175 [Collinsella stercoris DSM 13279]
MIAQLIAPMPPCRFAIDGTPRTPRRRFNRWSTANAASEIARLPEANIRTLSAIPRTPYEAAHGT